MARNSSTLVVMDSQEDVTSGSFRVTQRAVAKRESQDPRSEKDDGKMSLAIDGRAGDDSSRVLDGSREESPVDVSSPSFSEAEEDFEETNDSSKVSESVEMTFDVVNRFEEELKDAQNEFTSQYAKKEEAEPAEIDLESHIKPFDKPPKAGALIASVDQHYTSTGQARSLTPPRNLESEREPALCETQRQRKLMQEAPQSLPEAPSADYLGSATLDSSVEESRQQKLIQEASQSLPEALPADHGGSATIDSSVKGGPYPIQRRQQRHPSRQHSRPHPSSAEPSAAAPPSVSAVAAAAPAASLSSTAAAAAPVADSHYTARLRRKQSFDAPSATKPSSTQQSSDEASLNQDAPAVAAAAAAPQPPILVESPYDARVRRKLSQEPHASIQTPAATTSAEPLAATLPHSLSVANDATDNSYNVRARRKMSSDLSVPQSGDVATGNVSSLSTHSATNRSTSSQRSRETHHVTQPESPRGDASSKNPDLDGPDHTDGGTHTSLARSTISQSEPDDELSTGEDEGDRLFNMMRSGCQPSTSDRSASTVVSRNIALPRGMRPPMRYSSMPMELQGSFIDGGSGPFRCEFQPGAFTAHGRAFGDMPRWSRADPSNAQSTNRRSTRAVGIVTPDGSYRLPMDRERNRTASIPELYSVEAHLVQSSKNLEQFDCDLEAALRESREMIVAHQVVSEEKLEETRNEQLLKIICSVVAVLLAVFVILVVINKGIGTQTVPYADPGRKSDIVGLFPLIGTLPRGDDLCKMIHDSTDGTETMQPIEQCYCNGEIEYIPVTAVEAHYNVSAYLVNETVLIQEPLSTNCSDPENLAILWLAENKLEFKAPKQVVRRRYALAVTFHALNGLDWVNNTNWLSIYDECSWHGVVCDIYRTIKSVELPGNGLSGTIPAAMGDLRELATIDLRNNPGLVGTIPKSFAHIYSLQSVEVSGTSIGVTRHRLRA